jgi:hypothetical protein
MDIGRLHNLYFSPIIIMKIKLKGMRLVGHAALVVEKRYARNVLVTNLDGRKQVLRER